MNLNKKSIQWLILVIVSFIAGPTFILTKFALTSYTYGQVAALRIFFAFVILLPFIVKHLRELNKKNIWFLILVGFIGTLIPTLFFCIAQTKIDSAIAGILGSLTPLFTLIFAIFLFKEKASWLNVYGILIALVGAIGLIVKGDVNLFFQGTNWYALLFVISSACFGISINIIKNKLKDLNSMTITSISMIFIGPISGIYLISSDFSSALATENYIENVVFVFLIALFSVIAILLATELVKYTTAIFASSVTYIIPVFAIIWGVLYGEVIIVIDFVWTLVIFGGVFMVNKKVEVYKRKET